MKSRYMTSKEIAVLAECGIKKAQEIRKEVNEILESRGYKVVNQKKAPRTLVYEYLGIDEEK